MKSFSQKQIEKYFDRLFPLCRSITGNGLRESLKILREIIPLKLYEIPTGKKVFDWEIPKEWNIKDAFIITPDGKKICEFKKNNLHIVNYSTPINKEISFDDLKKHLSTLPEMPDAIPYITSYYKENWGFCIAYNEYKSLPKKGKYKVFIDSELEKGSLTYGDLILKGKTKNEILFSTYVCHPSMANNELSGPLVTAFLYQKVKNLKNRKYTYRFVFIPETIGSIAYLHKNGNHFKKNLTAGYVVTCVGHNGEFTYKKSKRGNTITDKIAEHILKFSGKRHKIIDFAVGGSDERQYCSPGFNLPVGSLMRTPYKKYKEYHTSLDNKKIISFSAMQETIETYYDFVRAFELNNFYKTTIPYGEPQLGKRGMYPLTGGKKGNFDPLQIPHLLTYSDGTFDLIDIAEKYSSSILHFEKILQKCKEKNLIK